MAAFEEIQQGWHKARLENQSSRRQLFRAEEKQKQLARDLAGLRRQAHAGNQAIAARLEALMAEQEALSGTIARLRRQAAEAGRLEAAQFAELQQFTDPTEHVARLSDRYPILLFPVRLETRFKELGGGEAVRHQLWVRVYPDDIVIDTFEETLAEVEIRNARLYWTNVWRAAGDEGGKRAAWRSLVKSHGAGRAYWIIGQTEPLNLPEEPEKEAGDFILVIVTDAPLAAAEKPAVTAYWQAVWQANNEPAALEAALNTLVAALGPARAETITTDYVPVNISERPANEEAITNVRVEYLELQPAGQQETQQQAWMHPAHTAMLPERFVLLGFNGDDETLRAIGNPVPAELVLGPNPNAPPEEQIHAEGDGLFVPDELKWMVDFEEAIAKGMGFRVDISAEQAGRGFDRLFVLGLRLRSDADTSAEQLETLIGHHQRSRKGFSLQPQGTPTNNTDEGQAGYRWQEDPDALYDHFFNQTSPDDPTDWRLMKDGRWLAESLGLNPDILKNSPNYYATDQCEARAMNMALWPATLGYFMEQMMAPVFGDQTIATTREFFNRYVVGRGTLPAIRVGHQPYGILPATRFTQMNWLTRPGDDAGPRLAATGLQQGFPFLARLYELIKKAAETWADLQKQVSYVGQPGRDPHQVLLDVIGLHPGSVEFYQRYAESFEHLYNHFKYFGREKNLLNLYLARLYVKSGVDLLAGLGYQANEDNRIPDILSKFFLKTPSLLKGPVIDDRPLSETERIRAYRPDGKNYLEWLVEAARESHDALRKQEDFIDDRPPTALLYLMLHHALDLSYLDTSFQLHLDAALFTPPQIAQLRQQPSFIHVQEAQADAGSLWQYLYKAEPAITGSETQQIGEYIPTVLSSLNPYLNSQIEALEHLQTVPTARLERAFAEHIDLCTYRLDAWWLGLVNLQLDLMRNIRGEGETGRGLYLGAFGWLEEVRSEQKERTPVQLDGELDEIFNRPGEPPLERDDQNFGYLHAPSLNHAVAAAVLRNGYLANATPANPESLSINLTSERVRLALSMIEGIRSGQSLGALLGYQLERGLHDQPGLFLDSLIFELRLAFPLAGNRLSDTKVEEEEVAIEAIEARNVVDGLALVEHIQDTGLESYPFGIDSLPDLSGPANAAKRNAVNEQVDRIRNINDAVADLAMAESVYQVVLGNYDRAAGTLEAFSKGHFPPNPEVIQTPRSGVTLTHRVGLHLEGGLDPTAPANSTPRAMGEPAINAWLAGYLPPANTVFCTVEYFDHTSGSFESEEFSQANLGLLPIDLLYLLNMDGEQEMKGLDDLILAHLIDNFHPRADVPVTIKYLDKKAGQVSFFEVAAYIRSLRKLLLNSRPLRPTDFKLANEAAKEEELTAVIDEAKISTVAAELALKLGDLTAFHTALAALLADPDPEVVASNAINNIDQSIVDYIAAGQAIGRFGLPGAGVAFAWDWKRQQLAALRQKLAALIERWEERLTEFGLLLDAYDALDPATGDEERFRMLLRAARLISTAVITPLPTANQLRSDLETGLQPAFEGVLQQLRDVLGLRTEISDFYNDLIGLAADLAQHDLEPLDLAENRTAIVAFAEQLRSKAESLIADVTARHQTAMDILNATDETSPANRVEALTQAARQLLGEDFVILPEFQLGEAQASEWLNGWDHRSQLLHDLTTVKGVDFPVDDWLYGVARVREKMQHLENVIMLGEALTGDIDLALTPLQFPYREDDAWLGLQFPEKMPGTEEPFTIDEDKLLYTAHYHSLIDPAAPQKRYCGLLLDEWTEVIPTTDETTGLSFHYDRPNSEPPQSLLLVTPSQFTGSWNWADLVGTLHDTLDMAKKRAVEPDLIDNTAYARFLPAVVSSVTSYPITLALNFAYNNAIQYKMEGGSDE